MSEQWNGIPREKVPWYPAIDMEKCQGCGVCVDFCSHGTYEMDNVTEFYLSSQFVWAGLSLIKARDR